MGGGAGERERVQNTTAVKRNTVSHALSTQLKVSQEKLRREIKFTFFVLSQAWGQAEFRNL